MKRVLACVLVAVVLAAVLGVPAAAAPVHKAVFVVGQREYTVDGQARQMDAAPFVEGGRAFVPIRYLAYAVGVAEKDVLWDEKSKTVTLSMDGVTVRLAVGSRVLRADGQAREMDVAPVVRGGRTYLPARFVAEAFGYEVKWVQESQAVLVGPPGNLPDPPKPPKPQPNYKIDMAAARSGALAPPPGAVPAPGLWGFPAKAVRMEFKIGSRYAKVTRPDGSMYTLDLGAAPIVVIAKDTYPVVGTAEGYKTWLIRNYGKSGYNAENVVIATFSGKENTAFYVPIIPVAEAFGVPKENIAWDGQHLALFGYYGDARNYRVFTVGTKEAVCKVVGNNPEVGPGKLNYPLFVKDGVPMVGINNVSDVSGLLFAVAGGSLPGLVAGVDDVSFKGWDYEAGTAGASLKPMI